MITSYQHIFCCYHYDVTLGLSQFPTPFFKNNMSLFLPEDASAIKISVTFKLNEGKCSLKKTEMFQEGLEQMIPGMNIKMQVSRLEP